MIRFDWHSFVTQHRVPFVTQGPNTARNHISVKCPYCGEADKSQHMGLHLDRNDPAWGCFRNARHRGRNPRRLVQRLLNITFQQAVNIVQEQQKGTADSTELDETLDRLRAVEEGEAQEPVRTLEAPGEFKPIVPVQGYAGRFLSYLAAEAPLGRGFGSHAPVVCSAYDLRYALAGEQAWRLIFPIQDAAGALVGWTGRDIRPTAQLRYLTTANLPHTALFNIRSAAQSAADVLVIVEGPVDAVKVDYFGDQLGITAVATLGTALPIGRRAVLANLARKFDRCALLFDEDTLPEVLSLAPELSETIGRNVELWRPGDDDPGAMNEQQVVGFLAKQLTRGWFQ